MKFKWGSSEDISQSRCLNMYVFLGAHLISYANVVTRSFPFPSPIFWIIDYWLLLSICIIEPYLTTYLYFRLPPPDIDLIFNPRHISTHLYLKYPPPTINRYHSTAFNHISFYILLLSMCYSHQTVPVW